MVELIDDLRSRARLLHHSARARDPHTLARLRVLPELRELDDAALGAAVRRRHCLAVLARELGFAGWPHVTAVLRGGGTDDFGTFLCPPGHDAFWNIWCASYDEAHAIHAEHGGFLLAYRKDYFITGRDYVAMLGTDPDDPDWDRIGRDWARPADAEARGRLFAKMIDSLGTAAAPR